ncbi:hypothetical protein GOP47_0000575 [Adiantum capillus-veneris]|uniref:Uncharacterized protein n=1 Tax=Adiantum capillus-veneris TaxID=13818 RepID=A0A9D4VD94_ADICA|nr:hypothetical protein GOP47_0000575 [Adiantum capillus-veneris]
MEQPTPRGRALTRGAADTMCEVVVTTRSKGISCKRGKLSKVPTPIEWKLLYDVQRSKEIHSRMDQERQRLSADDLAKEEEKVINDLAHKYGDRVGKVYMLNIVDPRLGEE